MDEKQFVKINPLKQLRIAHRFSCEEVGRIAGVSKAAVSYWELGETFPNDEHLKKITELFNIDFIRLKHDLRSWYKNNK